MRSRHKSSRGRSVLTNNDKAERCHAKQDRKIAKEKRAREKEAAKKKIQVHSESENPGSHDKLNGV